MTELSPEEFRILWAYQLGIQHGYDRIAELTEQLWKLRPQLGLDDLQALLRAKEREEAFDRVLDNPMEVYS